MKAACFLLCIAFVQSNDVDQDVCPSSEPTCSGGRTLVQDAELAELASVQLLHIVEESPQEATAAADAEGPAALRAKAADLEKTTLKTNPIDYNYVVVDAGTTCADNGYGDVLAMTDCATAVPGATGLNGAFSVVSSPTDDNGCFYVNQTNQIIFNSASSSSTADLASQYICVALGCNNSLNGATNWYDSEGPTFDCAWYAQGTRCSAYGDSKANFGMTAQQACCSCGGGDHEATYTTEPLTAGDTVVHVNVLGDIAVGDWIAFMGTDTTETKQVASLGSIVLGSPVENSYPPGTPVVEVTTTTTQGVAGNSDVGDAALTYMAHHGGTISFEQRTMEEGVTAWTDRDYTYINFADSGIPAGSTLFAGPHKDYPGRDRYVTFSSSSSGSLYLWSETGRRDGGWDWFLSGMATGKSIDFWQGQDAMSLDVYKIDIIGGEAETIPIYGTGRFVGGFAWAR